MVQIKNEIMCIAEAQTQSMLDELTEMLKNIVGDDIWMLNIGLAAKYGFSNKDIQGIYDGKVHDMSIREYNMLKVYLKYLLKKLSLPNSKDEVLNNEHEFEIEMDVTDDVQNRCSACNVESCSNCNGLQNDTCDNDNCSCNTMDNNDSNELFDFINNVNKELPDDSQINVNEAMDAKNVFDKDICKNVMSDYDKAAKQANLELFDTEKDINGLTINDLKYFIYKNHWDKEFNLVEINNRQTVLSFLYHKLEERIMEMLTRKNNVNQNDIDKVNKIKEEYNKKFNNFDYINNTIVDLLNSFRKLK